MRTKSAQHARGRSHMQAERRKSFAMRISSGVVAAAMIAFASVAWAAQPEPAGPQAAFEKGVAAYKAGAYSVALPALVEAASMGNEAGRFYAEFYLARIYSD